MITKQRVVLNGQSFFSLDFKAGVPQGTVLGPLLLLIYVYDLSDNLTSSRKLFSDGTLLFFYTDRSKYLNKLNYY